MGCPGPVSPDVVLPALDGALDAQGDVPLGPLCADDEALDTEFDKALGIDCTSVRNAINARRSSAEQARLEQARTYLRARMRRCCVSREQLIDHMRMRPENGLPTNPSTRRNVDRILGSMLCDRLSREIQSQHYATAHRECLFPRGSQDDNGLHFDGGDQ